MTCHVNDAIVNFKGAIGSSHNFFKFLFRVYVKHKMIFCDFLVCLFKRCAMPPENKGNCLRADGFGQAPIAAKFKAMLPVVFEHVPSSNLAPCFTIFVQKTLFKGVLSSFTALLAIIQGAPKNNLQRFTVDSGQF